MTTIIPQHEHALARANRIRLGRAQLKREVGRGDRSIVPILLGEAEADVLELVRTLPIVELLKWQHRWGDTRARRVLWLLGVSESRYETLLLEHLSPQRRGAMVALVARGAATAAQKAAA